MPTSSNPRPAHAHRDPPSSSYDAPSHDDPASAPASARANLDANFAPDLSLAPDASTLGSWRELLRPIPGGVTPVPDLANVRIALTHAPCWANLFAFNTSRYEISFLRHPPFALPNSSCLSYPCHWTDHHDILLLDWLQRAGIAVSHKQTVSQAVMSVARMFPYHPIRDYFNSIAAEWDGEPRIDNWLTTYLGAGESLYSRAVGRVFLVAAITRVFEPASKYDYCLILEGAQGTGKSTSLRVLAEPWFAESGDQLGSLNSILSLRGVLIMELPELSALEKVPLSALKRVITCQTDRIRPPYGSHVIDIPRESIFAGTSNHDTYLHDETGNRRFLPIRTQEVSPIDTDTLARDKDQLWAEAVLLYRSRSVKPYFEAQYLAAQAEREQRARYQADPWETDIGNWLRQGNWTSVTTGQILSACLGFAPKEMAGSKGKAAQMQVGKCLKALGWEKYRTGGAGRQSVWRPKRGGADTMGMQLVNGMGRGSGKRVGVGPGSQDYDEGDD